MTLTLILISLTVQAQVSISGQVLDATDGTPVVGANIFLANSLLGTTADERGFFRIDNLALGNYEFVISHVAYQRKIIKKTVESAQEVKLIIQLRPLTTDLAEVAIADKKDGKWRRNYKRFAEAFLGSTANAKKCEIMNPWVIDFSEKNGLLTAKSNQLLIIRNYALGYEIIFLLEHFQQKQLAVSYSGKPFFKEMNPENEKEHKRWERNRLKTYRGSLQHFLHALTANQLKSEGFDIYRARLKTDQTGFETRYALTASAILKQGNLRFKDFLQVVYTKEKEEQAYVNEQTAGQVNMTIEQSYKGYRPNVSRSHPTGAQVSYVYALKQSIELDANGFLKEPKLLKEYGYWAWSRVAELMPREFKK